MFPENPDCVREDKYGHISFTTVETMSQVGTFQIPNYSYPLSFSAFNYAAPLARPIGEISQTMIVNLNPSDSLAAGSSDPHTFLASSAPPGGFASETQQGNLTLSVGGDGNVVIYSASSGSNVAVWSLYGNSSEQLLKFPNCSLRCYLVWVPSARRLIAYYKVPPGTTNHYGGYDAFPRPYWFGPTHPAAEKLLISDSAPFISLLSGQGTLVSHLKWTNANNTAPSLEYSLGQFSLQQGQSRTLGRMRLSMLTNGNVVLYSGEDVILWQLFDEQPMTQANCNGQCRIDFQNDGNFVAYNGYTPYWASMTNGVAKKLVLSHTGLFIGLIDINGELIWSSHGVKK